MATSCKELTHLKRPWCWEGLGAGGEGDDRGWDGLMASLTRCTWVCMNSRSWWWTGRPGVMWFMGSQRVGHDWATELYWTEIIFFNYGYRKINSNINNNLNFVINIDQVSSYPINLDILYMLITTSKWWYLLDSPLDSII